MVSLRTGSPTRVLQQRAPGETIVTVQPAPVTVQPPAVNVQAPQPSTVNAPAAEVRMPVIEPVVHDRGVLLRVLGSVPAPFGSETGRFVAAGGGYTSDPLVAAVFATRAWLPVFTGEADGTRALLRIADWTGGSGTKPAVGYVSSTGGLVDSKAAAFNFNVPIIRRTRAQTAANGLYTWTFDPPFAAGVIPNVQALPEPAANTTDIVNAQLDGTPTNTQAVFRVTRSQRNTTAIIGITLLAVSATPGATWLHLQASAPQ